jgi:CBS domain-containing protein
MKLKDLMRRNVEVIAEGSTIRDAARRMCTVDIGALPVSKGDHIVGMVTDRDLVVRSLACGDDPDRAHVSDAMTRDVEWCYEDDELEDASRKMSDRQIQRMLVMNGDKRLVGIVSLGDLARARGAPAVSRTLQEIKAPTKPSAVQSS